MDATPITDNAAGNSTVDANGNPIPNIAKTQLTPAEIAAEKAEKERLTKAYYVGYVVYAITLVALIIYGMRSGRKGWYYAAAVLLLAPAAGSIVGGGVALFAKPKATVTK